MPPIRFICLSRELAMPPSSWTTREASTSFSTTLRNSRPGLNSTTRRKSLGRSVMLAKRANVGRTSLVGLRDPTLRLPPWMSSRKKFASDTLIFSTIDDTLLSTSRNSSRELRTIARCLRMTSGSTIEGSSLSRITLSRRTDFPSASVTPST